MYNMGNQTEVFIMGFPWQRNRRNKRNKRDKKDSPLSLEERVEALEKEVEMLKGLHNVTETVKDEDENQDVTVSVSDTPYVYDIGDMTIFDCIQEARKLELDMRLVNAKLGELEANQFIAWFLEYKKDYE